MARKAQNLVVDDPEARRRLVALADSLDCFLDEDVQLLAGVTAGTTQAWRDRGDGPAWSLVGNRPLYPRQAVSEWLATRLRERRPVEARGTL